MKVPGVSVTFQQVIPWELASSSKFKTLTTVGIAKMVGIQNQPLARKFKLVAYGQSLQIQDNSRP